MATNVNNYIPIFNSAIVRIFHTNGGVVGCGFLVSGQSQNYIITCAHVVAAALSLSKETIEAPSSYVYLDFPLLSAGQKLKAKVAFWKPVINGASSLITEDIAGLQIEEQLPSEAKPIKLILANDLWGHNFRIFGFPSGHNDGVWATGVIRAKQAKGWMQIEDIKATGYRVEPGFSGAPVWDETLAGVVGITVAAEKQREETKTAFIIPTDMILKTWNDLGLIASNERDIFPFKNRTTLINEIIDPNSPPYRLIIAPEGYGKTKLLLHVMHRFRELQWRCAYADISDDESISVDESIAVLEKRLASSLEIPMQEEGQSSLGENLGILLNNNWTKWQSVPQKGIILLIDLNRCTPPKQRLNEIFNNLQEFRSKIERCLKDLQFFKNTSKSFRVIIAARCLIDVPSEPFDSHVLTLSPFDWRAIQETATDYLHNKEMSPESINLLAGHLLYLTGGHPRGIAESLIAYKNGKYTVDSFLKSYGSKLWENTLKECRDQIRAGFTENDNLYESIQKLSIFPMLNSHWILKEAICRFDLPIKDHIKLNIKMRKTSIFTGEGIIIKDGMTRRLLAIGLLKESSPKQFQAICGKAAQICWDYIHYLKSKNDSNNSSVAGTWAMQYLFQYLHQYGGFINVGDKSINYRSKLRNNFFNSVIEKIISVFHNTDEEQISAFLSTLKLGIEKDREFQFVVNYYLRGDEYDDSLYRILVHRLDTEINNRLGEY